MRLIVLTLSLLLAGRLTVPAAALAQYHRLTDAVAVGATLSSAGSASSVLSGGPEIGGLIEVPAGDRFRLRGEAATGLWRFNGYPYAGVPGSAMRRHRLTLSILRARMPPSPRQRLSGYGGGGAGIYLYRFPARADGGAWGLHGIVGAEYLLRTMRSRWVAGAELQLHAMGEPRGPDGSLPMLSGHVTALIKYRLP
jgi:hypothetical protein